MSTITQKRRAINRTIHWGRYREQRAHLADLFGVIAYSGQPKRPLALGIKADLIGANTGLSEDEICHFLRAYTFGPRYLRALRVGAIRFDLDGMLASEVSREEADYAALSLKAHYADREWNRQMRVALRDLAAAQDMDWQAGGDCAPYPIDMPQPEVRAA